MLEDRDLGSQQSAECGIGGKGIQPFVGTSAFSHQLKEVYLVHYNGYVFAANFAKMLIIREREAKQDSQTSECSDFSSSSNSQPSQEEEKESEEEHDLSKIIKTESEEEPVISSD